MKQQDGSCSTPGVKVNRRKETATSGCPLVYQVYQASEGVCLQTSNHHNTQKPFLLEHPQSSGLITHTEMKEVKPYNLRIVFNAVLRGKVGRPSADAHQRYRRGPSMKGITCCGRKFQIQHISSTNISKHTNCLSQCVCRLI